MRKYGGSMIRNFATYPKPRCKNRSRGIWTAKFLRDCCYPTTELRNVAPSCLRHRSERFERLLCKLTLPSYNDVKFMVISVLFGIHYARHRSSFSIASRSLSLQSSGFLWNETSMHTSIYERIVSTVVLMQLITVSYVGRKVKFFTFSLSIPYK